MGVARAEPTDAAASEGAGLRCARAELIELLLVLARRSLAGVCKALVLGVRAIDAMLLSDARVLRCGRGTPPLLLPLSSSLPETEPGEGPLLPLDALEAAAAAAFSDALATREELVAGLAVLEAPLTDADEGLAPFLWRS